jgi:hypothetical protein
MGCFTMGQICIFEQVGTMGNCILSNISLLLSRLNLVS